ncbi:phosphotyrosine protein phosphatase [bacterium]|nr:phosphotyrosine protein phosphatase [bacterium]
MRRLLFVCSHNRARSPTAAWVFSQLPDTEAKSAGLSEYAVNRLTPELIAWAEVIFVMERAQRSKLIKLFGNTAAGKRIVVLGIRDEYECMDPGLVSLLEAKSAPWRAPPPAATTPSPVLP